VAYALACVEREEQLSARRAYQLLIPVQEPASSSAPEEPVNMAPTLGKRPEL
jgi:hypothetical protein